jgi:molybdate transport system regulatory protein
MPRHYTSAQVCELLGISAKTLYLWERSGKIPRPARDRRGWRVFTERQVAAVRRHVGSSVDAAVGAADSSLSVRGDGASAGLSARNQIRGTVVSIHSEGILSEVVLRLPDGQEIVAVVTRRSVQRLGLKKGGRAAAVIKATEVMLST